MMTMWWWWRWRSSSSSPSSFNILNSELNSVLLKDGEASKSWGLCSRVKRRDSFMPWDAPSLRAVWKSGVCISRSKPSCETEHCSNQRVGQKTSFLTCTDVHHFLRNKMLERRLQPLSRFWRFSTENSCSTVRWVCDTEVGHEAGTLPVKISPKISVFKAFFWGPRKNRHYLMIQNGWSKPLGWSLWGQCVHSFLLDFFVGTGNMSSSH